MLKYRNKIILLLIIFLSVFAFMQTNVEARKKRFSGRSDGMASIDVTANDFQDVAQAVKKVFRGDGYTLKDEWGSGLQFSRSAGRMKDFSYGGLTSGGMWEQVMIDIHTVGIGSYRIECNVYMTEGDKKPAHMDTDVLKMFGREYKRMLRRVKRNIN